jgi:hypothetical protein
MRFTSYEHNVIDKNNLSKITRLFVKYHGNVDNFFTNELSNYCRPFESPEEEESLWQAYVAGDRKDIAIRDVICERYIWLTFLIYFKLSKRFEDYKDDVYSLILSELLACVQNFNIETDVKFGTYLTVCCEFRIGELVRDIKTQIKISKACAAKMINVLSLDIDENTLACDNSAAMELLDRFPLLRIYKMCKISEFKERIGAILYGGNVASLNSFTNDNTSEKEPDVLELPDDKLPKYEQERHTSNFIECIQANFENAVKTFAKIDYYNRFAKCRSSKYKCAVNQYKKDKLVSLEQTHRCRLLIILERVGIHFDNGQFLYDGKSSTLQELGSVHNLTRERVRQIVDIETKFIKRNFNTDSFLDVILGDRGKYIVS